MTPLDTLLLELIPQRLTPAPRADRGPTVQWERHQLITELDTDKEDTCPPA